MKYWMAWWMLSALLLASPNAVNPAPSATGSGLSAFLGVAIFLLSLIGLPLLGAAIIAVLIGRFVKSAEKYKKWLNIITVVCVLPIL
ncbi:MAG TPA: hypothetical protein VJH24_02845, partial [Candidatus Bilamarchaeaceae archaeon]|nr:hypothetical protein [Candidatus Bilamarchaeaceae archaeon]